MNYLYSFFCKFRPATFFHSKKVNFTFIHVVFDGKKVGRTKKNSSIIPAAHFLLTRSSKDTLSAKPPEWLGYHGNPILDQPMNTSGQDCIKKRMKTSVESFVLLILIIINLKKLTNN